MSEADILEKSPISKNGDNIEEQEGVDSNFDANTENVKQEVSNKENSFVDENEKDKNDSVKESPTKENSAKENSSQRDLSKENSLSKDSPNKDSPNKDSPNKDSPQDQPDSNENENPDEQKEQETEAIPEIPQPTLEAVIEANGEKIKDSLSLFVRDHNVNSYAFLRLSCAEKELIGLSGCLSGFKHLKFVDLSKNNLTNLEGLSSMESIVKLNVSENSITALPNELNDTCFRFLEELDLSKNKLKSAKITFAPALKRLNVSFNEISILEVEDLPKLEFLDLRKNAVSSISGLQNLIWLSQIYAAENKFTSLRDFSHHRSLKTLHLRANPITDSNFDLPVVEYLNLRQTSLTHPPSIDKIPMIRSINFIDCKIEAEKEELTKTFIKNWILNQDLEIRLLIRTLDGQNQQN